MPAFGCITADSELEGADEGPDHGVGWNATSARCHDEPSAGPVDARQAACDVAMCPSAVGAR
jgi:hypothetical protein